MHENASLVFLFFLKQHWELQTETLLTNSHDYFNAIDDLCIPLNATPQRDERTDGQTSEMVNQDRAVACAIKI